MKVKLAKTAGFCFGVKRAVDKVYEQIKCDKENDIYTFGPIIHNDEVVNDLKKKGVKVLNSTEELKNTKKGVIVIRSHGVPREIYDIINENNLKIVDATCPFVKKIHNAVDEQSRSGRIIIIIGDKNHPEVIGIKGWSNTEPIIIGDAEEAEKINLPSDSKICIVAQTTFNYNNFKYMVEIIDKKGYDILVLNTICNATHERQEEAEQISRDVDAMIVIGNKNSSNTRKLYEICKKNCNDTFYIQTLVDLDLCKIQSSTYVGITAGASTPNNIIEEVHNNVRNEF